MMPPAPRLNLTATTNRATGQIRLEWDYRHAPEAVSQQQEGLSTADLDRALASIRADGWTLESQCANPGRESFVETYTFVLAE